MADEVSRDEREELEAIRRRVVNVVGHELRTPVTTVHGLAEQIARADSLEAVRELAPALLRGTTRLQRLLDDLLIASGIGTALPVEPPVPQQVAPALRQVWRDLAGEDGLTVDGDARVQAAPGVMERIFGHVLANAHAYGTGPPTVTVATRQGQVEVVVHSPGPALHPEEVRLALEPFFRGEQAVMARPGLGLGLAIAQALAVQSGGGVQFSAADEGGTVTTVTMTSAP